MKTRTLLFQFECDDSAKVFKFLHDTVHMIPSIKVITFIDIFNPDMLHYFQVQMSPAERDGIELNDVLNRVPEQTPTWAEKCFLNWTAHTRQL